MEDFVSIFLTILAVSALVWAIWAKARGNQKALDSIERLEQIVRGQEAALKLKREQERLHDQENTTHDLEIAAKIRATRDARAAIGFVQDAYRPTGPGPGDDAVSSPEAPGKAEPGKR